MYEVPLVKDTFLEESRTKKALADFILKANFLSMGKECREFEERFALYQGRKHAALFNSGGSANLALLQALKNLGRLKDGDMVGFSAVTWSTNVMPIIQLGLRPVPVDCSRETLNVSSDALKNALNKYPLKALFLTNALGFSGDINAIKEICGGGVLLLEDNCESLGSEFNGIKLGNFGLASTFSFYVSHHMSTVEGGMVCTDDPELYSMIKLVRSNGWDRNLTDFEKSSLREIHGNPSDLDSKYTFYDLGYNLRPTEITGFLGKFQLDYLPESVIRRQSNYLRIEKAMANNEDLITIKRDGLNVISAFAVPVLCRTRELRNLYAHKLEAAGVEVRPLIAGNMERQPFYGKYIKTRETLMGSDFIHDCGLYCGNHPDYSEHELSILERVLGEGV